MTFRLTLCRYALSEQIDSDVVTYFVKVQHIQGIQFWVVVQYSVQYRYSLQIVPRVSYRFTVDWLELRVILRLQGGNCWPK